MPKKAGMEKWKKKRRQEYLEMKQYRYYIFCEGQQTEPLYFMGFKKLIEDNPIYKDMVLIEIEPCQAETMRVIGMAERYVKKNKIQKGQIWCVYDKDSFPADDFNGVVNRAENLNKESSQLQYHTAWSNECIEFWFLLHYLNTNRYFATSDDVIDVLHRYMPNFSKHQSFLSKEAWVSELLADNRLDKAIANANIVGMEGESYSRLPKLFEIVDTK